MVWKVKHNVLELQISVNNQNVDHITEPLCQLLHDLMDDLRLDVVLFHGHQILHITSIAELHENIVPRISLDSFSQLNYVFALD